MREPLTITALIHIKVIEDTQSWLNRDIDMTRQICLIDARAPTTLSAAR